MKIVNLALFGSVLLFAACEADDDMAADEAADTTAIGADLGAADTIGQTGAAATQAANAQLQDADGQELGILTLTETGDAIAVAGRLEGLPAGNHAIHIHETGQCEPPFQSAGGHWNPTSQQHGLENPEGPHLGDMPNIEVGDDGTVDVQVATPAGATMEGPNGLLDGDGAAVVIHAEADDYRTDPAGDAGDRIACGVIEAS